MKGSSLLLLAGAGLAAYFIFGKNSEDGGGYGGFFPIPNTQTPGADSTITPDSTVQPFQISDKILAAMAGSTTKKESGVFSAIAGYGDSGVYSSQPSRYPTGNTGGIGLLPFGASTDYQPSPSVSSDVKKSVSTPSLDFSSQGGGNYSGNVAVAASKKSVSSGSNKGGWF